MIRKLLLSCILLGAGVGFGVSSAHAATDFGPIVVSVENPPTGQRDHGYIEYRVRVTNRSSQSDHQVRLTIPGIGYGGGSELVVSRQVTVGGGSSVVVPLLVPVLPTYGSGIAVTIDGREQGSLVELNLVQHGEYRPSVLVSEKAESFDSVAAAQPMNAGNRSPFSAVAAGVSTKEWSENWLAYSSYDAIVMTGEEFLQLPAPVSVALLRFVEAGGTLVVIGNVGVPHTWRVRQNVKAPLRTFHVGFGQFIPVDDLSQLNVDQWLSIQESFYSSHIPWVSATRQGTERNQVFPIVDKLTVPVRGLFLLMLLFVIVIGPVNLLLLARKKKKMWLLWTVPTISLVTCIAVSVYTVLAEGWSGRSRTASITLLDEGSHRATTLGWTAFYSPLTPGDGLRFGYETELNPEVAFDYYRVGRSPGRLTIDWTSDQHLVSGWISARVPAHFTLRKSEVRRERLAIKKEQDGSFSVVNGLGADIRELWFADREGRIHTALNLAAGASTRMISQTNSLAAGEADVLRKAFTDPWFDLAKWSDPSGLLMRNCYVAIMDRSPFVEEGMPRIQERKDEAIVYGIMKEPADEN